MDPRGQQAVHVPLVNTNTMSTMFHPRFQVNGMLPDVALISTDNITFHIHRQQLLAVSTNAFTGILTQPTRSLALPESSSVLNIVLHIIYGMSCLRYQPPFESTDAALASLIKYGVPATLLATSRPLFELVLSYAPYRPIEAYALAGHYGLEQIAVAVSAHLLAYDITKLSDELSVKMGSTYLNRLFKLHQVRLAALRDIVLPPPAPHPPTVLCNERTQRQLSRAWAFANAEIVWHALPSTSTGALESTFMQAGVDITCPDCKATLRNRIAEVTAAWAAVKRTI